MVNMGMHPEVPFPEWRVYFLTWWKCCWKETPPAVSLLWGMPELKEAALPKVMLFLQWLLLLQWPNPLAPTGDT